MHFAQNSRVGISIEMVCNKRRAQKHDEYVFFLHHMDSKKNEMELNIVYQTCPNGLGQKVIKDGLKTPV